MNQGMVSRRSNRIFWGLPYTLEVPVNYVHAVKVSHPPRAVDKL